MPGVWESQDHSRKTWNMVTSYCVDRRHFNMLLGVNWIKKSVAKLNLKSDQVYVDD